jgi:integrase
MQALESYRDQQVSERSALGTAWHESDFVFTTALGTLVHPRNHYRAFQALLCRAGLRRVRLHDLRHTAASLLMAQGVPARVVMEIMGHFQVSITLNTYSHVDTRLTQVAADRMERRYGQKKATDLWLILWLIRARGGPSPCPGGSSSYL